MPTRSAPDSFEPAGFACWPELCAAAAIAVALIAGGGTGCASPLAPFPDVPTPEAGPVGDTMAPRDAGDSAMDAAHDDAWQPADVRVREPRDVVTDAPPMGPRVADLALGAAHTCARLESGEVRCWGAASHGELGDGTTAARSRPGAAVTGVAGARAIAAGRAHTCVVLADGTARCWGANESGQLGDGTTSERATPAAVRVAGGGELGTIARLTVGAAHACAVLMDGTARCWGANDAGQLGAHVGANAVNAVPLVAPGETEPLQVREVALGAAHTCVLLTASSEVRCFGRNDAGQLGALAKLGRAAHVFAGARQTCAVEGMVATAQCWGAGESGQLGNGQAASGPAPLPIAAASGADLLERIDTLAMGERHTCARLMDRRVVCWGLRGRVGVDIEDLPYLAQPAPRSTVRDALAVAAGAAHTCAVDALGTVVWCWGENTAGQLGDGTSTTREAPVAVRW